MRTALRKMGNSTGVILPRGILGEAGLTTGAVMDIAVEGGKVVLTPVRKGVREGWEEAAAEIGKHDDLEAAEWLDMPNEADDDWEW